jgi:two-component system NtrC family sensor kinase|tara:strand:+ start:703 stop:1617 length:915 start_codon:yes stop_codon:yes gene_type:complete
VSDNPYEKAYQREKSARNEAEHLLEDLSRKLYEKNEEVNQLYEDLKRNQSIMVQHEKLASVGELASGIAHEINNPVGFCLTNINTLHDHLPILLDACDAGSPGWDDATRAEAQYIREDLPALVRETLDGLISIQTIVRDLRYYSRNSSQDSFSGADLNQGIKATLNVLRNKISAQYPIHLNLGDIPLISCNQGKLNQVFTNLILNGLQAMGDSGNLYIDSYQDADQVVIRISDDGPGIDDAIALEIFQPFYTTKKVGEGTGLGLSISRSIITELHAGQLRLVDDGRGQGATFEIRIPTEQAESG